MSDSKRYYAAVEVKGIVSYHIRRIGDIKDVVKESGEVELIELFNESELACQRLYAMASEIADKDRPEIVIPDYVDRGIDDFLSSNCGCDDDCAGGCSGCSSGCKP